MEKNPTAEFWEGMTKLYYPRDIVKIVKGLPLEARTNIKIIPSVYITLLHLCLPSVRDAKGFHLSNYDIALT